MNDAAGSSRPRASEAEHGVVLPKTAARQGVTGHNVRYVLAASLIGVIIIFGGLWYFMAG